MQTNEQPTKRSRGRPQQYDEKKVARSHFMTPTAHAYIRAHKTLIETKAMEYSWLKQKERINHPV